MDKIIKGLIVLVTLGAAQSCVKSIDTSNRPKITNVQDLKVPSNFDWVTSKIISCTVNATTPTVVEIYTDKACEQELLAKYIAHQGASTLSMSVSQATDKLYLKYTTAANATQVLTSNVSSSSSTFSVTDGIEAPAEAPKSVATNSTTTRSVPIYDGGGYISYPSGWGTILYEDLFPYLGDYDFNDFVASYQIAVEFPWRNAKYDTKYANMVRVHLKLKAVGGSLEYIPYVRIAGLNKNNVTLPEHPYNDTKYVNPLIYNNTTDGVKVSKIDSDQTSDVILQFNGLNATNPNRIPGASYYNTTPGAIIRQNLLTEVVVYLSLKEEVETATLLDDKIDIFLASPDKSKEIHVRGFKPVFAPYDYSVSEVNKTTTYATPNNLIWGMKVSTRLLHASEGINFCAAYPEFAAWAQSGGTTNLNWYNTNVVKDKLIVWPK